MNCQSFEGIVGDLARDRILDQTLEANLRESARLHLNECATCALRLQDGRALTYSLDELAKEMKSVTAPASVEEKLRQAFREGLAAPVVSPILTIGGSRVRGRWNSWNLSITAVAVVFLIVLGIVGLRLLRYPQPGRLDGPEARSSPKQLQVIVKAGISSLPPKPDRETSDAGRRTNPYRRARHSFSRNGSSARQTKTNATTPTASDTDSEVATQFMPLGYAGPINLQDGGQLVRVEMSRAAMFSLGLPVNMDRYSERVKADVLFDADGFARAIRFVQ